MVLAYTDYITRGVSVDKGVFKKVKGYLGEKDLVELTVVAGYNCVSWFLVALDIGENNRKLIKRVEDIVKGVKQLAIDGKGLGGF